MLLYRNSLGLKEDPNVKPRFSQPNNKVAQSETMNNCLKICFLCICTLYIGVSLPEGQADWTGVATLKLSSLTPSFRKMLRRAAQSGEK